MRKGACVAALFVVVMAVFLIAQAQPGPPALPGCTQIFQTDMPFLTNQSGCYVVMENLTGSVGSSGITINHDHVTIDLNGFNLIGVPDSIFGIEGVSRRNITIINGTVRDWGNHGIKTNATVGNLLKDLHVFNNGVSQPPVSDGMGIFAGLNSVIVNCTASNNNDHGIQAQRGSIIRECVAKNNGGIGIQGLESFITECVASDNGLDIHISGGSTFGKKCNNLTSDGSDGGSC